MKPDRRRLEQLTKQAANTPPPSSPLAQARLEKTLKEIQFLETRIKTCELEQRQLEGELLRADDAIAVIRGAICPFADGLKRMPKFIAPRLVGATIGQIEIALSEEANRLLKLGDHALKTAIQKVGREL